MSLTKECDDLSKATDDIHCVVTITNDSSSDAPDLILDSFSDDLFSGDVPEACETLAYGGSCTIEYDYTVLETDPDPLVNTATVHYHPYGFLNDIWDSDTESTNLFQPGVELVKEGPLYSKATDYVDYTITITNTSSEDAPDLILDSFIDTLVTGITIPEACNTLASGDYCTITYSHLVTTEDPDPLVNTATVHYHPDGFGNDIWDDDVWEVELIYPSFTIEKEGDDYSKYDYLADVPFGDVIDYTLTLVNTGDVELVNGVLTDTLEPAVVLPVECETLSVGETCYVYYSHTVTEAEGLEADLSNTATVSYALPTLYALSNIITENDSWTTTLLHPDFSVTKECISEDLMTGDDAVFGVTFSNTGDADLVFVANEDLYDEVAMAIIPAGTPIDVLVGETLIFTVTMPYDPEPEEPLAMVSNTVEVTVTLADEYGLTNSWTAEATGVCQYQYWAFTPGFWKNHTSSSPAGHDAWQYTAYDPGELLVDVGFILGELGSQYPKGSEGSFSTLTLLQALRLKGGAGIVGAGEILLRAGVASLLNASFHETMWGTVVPYFPMTSAEVIEAVNTAIATVDPVVMLELAAELDGYNNGYEYFDWTWQVP